MKVRKLIHVLKQRIIQGKSWLYFGLTWALFAYTHVCYAAGDNSGKDVLQPFEATLTDTFFGSGMIFIYVAEVCVAVWHFFAGGRNMAQFVKSFVLLIFLSMVTAFIHSQMS